MSNGEIRVGDKALLPNADELLGFRSHFGLKQVAPIARDVLSAQLAASGPIAVALTAATSGIVDRDAVTVVATGNVTRSGLQVLDGYQTVANDRVLLFAQTNPAENGIYVAASGAWSRSFDADAEAELINSTHLVLKGNTYAGYTFKQFTQAPITVGSTNLYYVIIRAPATPSGFVSGYTGDDDDVAAVAFVDPLGVLYGQFDKSGALGIGGGKLAKTSKIEQVLTKAGAIVREADTDVWANGPLLLKRMDAPGVEIHGPNDQIYARIDEPPDIVVPNNFYIPPGKKVYLDGDSRSDLASNPNQTTAQGWLWWLQVLTRARFDFSTVQNFGVGGAQSEEMLGRVSQLAGLEPGTVIAICGTNDRTDSWLASRTIAALKEYQRIVLSYGHRLIWIAEAPRGDSTNTSWTLTADQLLAHFSVRQWILDQGSTPNVYVADPFEDMVDPALTNGRALDTVLRDGIHWGAPGASIVARKLQPIIENLFPPRPLIPVSNADLFGSDNEYGSLNTNPMLLGTGGTAGSGASGSIATGWTVVCGAGLAAVCSKGTMNGKECQEIVVSGGPTGLATTDSNGRNDPQPIACVLSCPITAANILVGDVLGAVAEIELLAGSSGLRAVALYLSYTTAAGTYLYSAGEPDVIRSQINLNFPSTALAGVQQTPSTASLLADVVSAKVMIVISGANMQSTAQAISATVRVRAVKSYKR